MRSGSGATITISSNYARPYVDTPWSISIGHIDSMRILPYRFGTVATQSLCTDIPGASNPQASPIGVNQRSRPGWDVGRRCSAGRSDRGPGQRRRTATGDLNGAPEACGHPLPGDAQGLRPRAHNFGGQQPRRRWTRSRASANTNNPRYRPISWARNRFVRAGAA